jgi:hypothetical protein
MMSFIAVKIRRCSINKVGIMKALGEDAKQALLSGKDFDVVEIEAAVGQKITDLISWLETPQWHPEIWNVIEKVFDLFDKRVGLTELMYGVTDTQPRSATEMNVKQQNLAIRPQDMLSRVEDFMSRVAAKEALAMRWLLKGQDMQPVLGQVGALMWDQVIASADIGSVVREFDYRVQSGSLAKPDSAVRSEQANTAVQMWAPLLQGHMQATGDPGPVNQLANFWSEATSNPFKFQLQGMPPPQPAPPGEEKAA